MFKPYLKMCLLLVLLSACDNRDTSPLNVPATVIDDTSQNEIDEVVTVDSITLMDEFINNSSYYLGSYDMTEELKRHSLKYYSRFNLETYLDTTAGRQFGYSGTVEIKNLSRKGFDFTIELVAVNQCSGWVEGRAIFNALNRATSVQIENSLPEMCVLEFTFLEGKLIVQQSRCMDYHGKACQFEDVYLAKPPR